MTVTDSYYRNPCLGSRLRPSWLTLATNLKHYKAIQHGSSMEQQMQKLSLGDGSPPLQTLQALHKVAGVTMAAPSNKEWMLNFSLP